MQQLHVQLLTDFSSLHLLPMERLRAAVSCFDAVKATAVISTVSRVPSDLYLQVSNHKLVDEVVPGRLLEDRQVSKVMLQPPCLGLG